MTHYPRDMIGYGRTPPFAASVPQNIAVPSASPAAPDASAINSRGSSIAATVPS